MSKQSKIKAFIQFSYGTWGVAIISFFSTPLITWLILPQDFGKASMFTIAFNLLLNIVLLGTDQSFSRFFFEKGNEDISKLFRICLVVPFILWAISSIFIYFFWAYISVLLFSTNEPVSVGVILVFSVFFGIVSRFGLLYLRMLQVANSYSILQIVSGIINIIIVIGYAYFIERNFFAIIIAFLITNGIIALISIIIKYKEWKKIIGTIWSKQLIEVLKYGYPFVPVFIIDWLFQATDRFFLKEYSDIAAIGLYSVGFKLVTALNLLQSGFNLFWVPFSYEEYNKNPGNTTIFSKVFNMLTPLLLVIMVLIIGFKDIIASIFSSSYNGVGEIIPFLLFIPIMYTLSEITVVGINFKKKTHFHLYITLISFICNVLFCILFIPAFGIKGAAIATGLSYFIFFCLRSAFAINLYKINYDWVKFFLSFSAVFFTALLHTLYSQYSYIIFSNIITIFLIMFLYRFEFKEIIYISMDLYSKKMKL